MAWGKKSTLSTPSEVDRALRRSLRAALAGDLATAETWLERVVEYDTHDRDTYHALARLYRQQGGVGRAIRMHQNLLLRPDLSRDVRSEALLELARDFDEGGFGERAASAYEEVLEAQPRNVEVLEPLILRLQALREYPRALALLKRFRRTDRETADRIEVEVLLAHAQAQVGEGDSDAARHSLKACLKRNKECGAAWALLGELEVERGKEARALEAWKKGAAVDAELAGELYPKIDAAFAARGKPEAFAGYLRDILEDEPLNHSAQIALARALASRGEAQQGIEVLARAIEVAPYEARLHAELGRQLLSSGQEAEALKAYSSLIDVLERSPGLVLGKEGER